MEDKHLIAAFEMSFSTSVKHTARVRYEVDFNNSNIVDTLKKLQELKSNIDDGPINQVHVGLNITYADVEYIESLLNTIISRYKVTISPTLPKKIQTLLDHLRTANEVTPMQMAKEIAKEILHPTQPPDKKLSLKERKDLAVAAKTVELRLQMAKNPSNSPKHKGN